MTDELKPFNISEELAKAIAATTKTIEGRSFSERHPELGKMVNCRVCGTRHRANEKKCEQVFTYRVGDYEYFREDEQGLLVPDYRTATRPDEKPTRNQYNGAPRMMNFSMPRYHPHPSKVKLQFIERTRKVFEELGYPLERAEKEEIKDFQEQFEKNLQRARVLAAREIRKERELSDREIRRRQDQSRRINRGLQVKVRA
jgi:hypothetical protein